MDYIQRYTFESMIQYSVYSADTLFCNVIQRSFFDRSFLGMVRSSVWFVH